ncbi:APC family permease [Francisella adeliensis]|uniref:Amino acid permease n=1 Tax=Francisella adeliensis TaxID=2007306 RepID=A0A2Z4XZT5_9GAMM|nr:APC family permease [Francisella adeliensis]AXA33953.1 amino acid:proton antiporter [Francisella adeliensis]MBK2085862.1 amino acid permease [Francisella adeliensis]MBK2097740.1 amino acid permease [Francisella adeliensis]QIW12189.1 amino acid permease [Francisella adeliensis]QIW14065.1 amino acid permease [Francisella adeliensis]
MNNSSKKDKIGIVLLVLLMTGAIDNIRNLPSTATSGTYIFFFFAVAILLFLAPVALVSAEMTATYTNKGEEGVYGWVKKAFGPNVAMLAIWFQWVNTLIWFPSILTFLAGTVAYIFNPDLGQNIKFTIIFITVTFWLLTILNLKGLKVSAVFASICTFLGMVIPMILMVIFAIIWLSCDQCHNHLNFQADNLIPNFHSTESWMGLTAIIASFLGLELATVHITNVKKPKKTFPLALFISVVFIIFTMVLGALAVSLIFPQSEIDVVHGTIKTFKIYLEDLGIPMFFYYALGMMIIVGSVGSMINWMISPARGLLQAADDHFLPKILDKKNSHDVPSGILILQAIIMTIICLLLELVPSVQAYYWLLTALSTQIYSLMYLMMFIAALKLKFTDKRTQDSDAFRIPGGKIGMTTISIAGILGTCICVIVGFIPPDNMYDNPFEFIKMLAICLISSIIPVVLFMIYRNEKVNH